MADQVFGIDLGTTYSAIARINEFAQAEVIDNQRDGSGPTTPSVVHFANETTYVVGQEAKNERLLSPDTTISLIKRHMGTEFSTEIFGKTFTPESISALILKDLVDYARISTGADTTKVVITVPAYFGAAEKEATRQAGQLAGLNVIGIVPEPVAAALSVGFTGEQTKTLFVYDLGGGTFDCTIIRLSPGKLETIVIDGDRLLGGADWDAKLVGILNEKFKQQAGLSEDPSQDLDFSAQLLEAAENLKKSLSKKERAFVTLKYRTQSADALEKVEVTRTEFEEASRDKVDLTLDIVRRTLATAMAKQPNLELDEVLLVGGSSRMPMIRASLEMEMGWTVRETDLDLAVAKGAAIYGQGTVSFEEISGSVTGESAADAGSGSDEDTVKRIIVGEKQVEIQNVLSRGLGIMWHRPNPAASGGAEPWIGFEAHANDSLPLVANFSGSTLGDNATQIAIRVFEQAGEKESKNPHDNKEVTPDSGAVFTNLPNLPAGSPIDFELGVSSEGIASLAAYEPASGQRLKLEISLAVMQKEAFRAAQETLAVMTRRD